MLTHNLRPFKKGQSGNPGGLPKGTPKIVPALVRFLAMPSRIFQNYRPRSVAEEIAKNLIEIALWDNPSAALRATIVICDRVEGKPAKSIYHHPSNGEITIEYENDWQPPQVEMERGDVWDDEKGVLYPVMDELKINREDRKYGFHLLRHTAATVLHEQTGGIEVAQRALGHARRSTTEDVYDHAEIIVDEETTSLLVQVIIGDANILRSEAIN